MSKSNKPIALELRNQILREYLTGNVSTAGVASRYGISPNTIGTWLRRYVYPPKKYVPLCRRQDLNEENMAKKIYTNPSEEAEILRREVKALQQQLRQVQLEKLALKTLIDIAEEQGICLRKKSGAKQ